VKLEEILYFLIVQPVLELSSMPEALALFYSEMLLRSQMEKQMELSLSALSTPLSKEIIIVFSSI